MRKRIAYIVGQDPTDKRAWSGTCYSCLQELTRFYDVSIIAVKSNIIEIIIQAIYTLFCLVFSYCPVYSSLSLISKNKCRRINKILQKKEYDGIFLIGVELGAYIKTKVPILYFSDATFNLMVDYYWPNCNRRTVRQGNLLQKKCLQNSTYCMFASGWAINGAVNYYGIPRDKCILGKLGANVDTSSFEHKEHGDNIINLLFVGVDWKRKGGDIAVECVEYLNKADKEKRYVLHIVGSLPTPPRKLDDEYIKIYGFLNRNIPEQQNLMISLREKADIFILPTQAECAGIVFCESSAYGIPSITYDTGGIGDYVINGENGYRLPIGASGKEFARVIMDLVNSPGKLNEMRKNAKEMYSKELNWNHLGDIIHSVLR